VLRVDLEDVDSAFKVRQVELDLTVDSAWPHECGVQCVGPVGRHQHLDVSPGFKTVHLVDDFQHSPLNLVISSRSIVKPCTSDGIDLVEEDDAGLLGPCHLEDLTHHSGAFSNILLNQLRTDNSDEAGVSSVGDGSCGESLASSRRTVEQDSLWRIDSQVDELFRSEKWHLNHFPQLFQLFLAASDIVVGDIGLVLHGHHGDSRIDLGWKRHLDLVLLAVDSNSHAFLHVGGRQLLAEFDYEFGDLLEMNDIFLLVSLLNDFVAASHLKRLLSGTLGVFSKVPLCGQ
jgi:hypothetical protein